MVDAGDKPASVVMGHTSNNLFLLTQQGHLYTAGSSTAAGLGITDNSDTLGADEDHLVAHAAGERRPGRRRRRRQLEGLRRHPERPHLRVGQWRRDRRHRHGGHHRGHLAEAARGRPERHGADDLRRRHRDRHGRHGLQLHADGDRRPRADLHLDGHASDRRDVVRVHRCPQRRPTNAGTFTPTIIATNATSTASKAVTITITDVFTGFAPAISGDCDRRSDPDRVAGCLVRTHLGHHPDLRVATLSFLGCRRLRRDVRPRPPLTSRSPCGSRSPP